MTDQEIIEGILRIIGRDSELLTQFADGLEIDEDELGEFIDEGEFPRFERKDSRTL